MIAAAAVFPMADWKDILIMLWNDISKQNTGETYGYILMGIPSMVNLNWLRLRNCRENCKLI